MNKSSFRSTGIAAALLALITSLALIGLSGCSNDHESGFPTAPSESQTHSASAPTIAATSVNTARPTTDTYFICPSVSTHNPNGMWVIGHHGAYYVNIPTQGGANGGSKVYLTIPVHVASIAQIPAGWALYKDLPSYPNFVGMAGLLAEGISTWLGSPAGWQEGDGTIVMDNGNGTYNVTDVGLNQTITVDHPIPLQSAAVW